MRSLLIFVFVCASTFVSCLKKQTENQSGTARNNGGSYQINAKSLDEVQLVDAFIPHGQTKAQFVEKMKVLFELKKRNKEIDSLKGHIGIYDNALKEGKAPTDQQKQNYAEAMGKKDEVDRLGDLLQQETDLTQSDLVPYMYLADPWMEAQIAEGHFVRCHLANTKLIGIEADPVDAAGSIWPGSQPTKGRSEFMTFKLRLSVSVDYFEEIKPAGSYSALSDNCKASASGVVSCGRLSMPKAFKLGMSLSQTCPIPVGTDVFIRRDRFN